MRVYVFLLTLMLAVNTSLSAQEAPETEPPPSIEAAPEAVQPPDEKGPGEGDSDARPPLRQAHDTSPAARQSVTSNTR